MRTFEISQQDSDKDKGVHAADPRSDDDVGLMRSMHESARIGDTIGAEDSRCGSVVQAGDIDKTCCSWKTCCLKRSPLSNSFKSFMWNNTLTV